MHTCQQCKNNFDSTASGYTITEYSRGDNKGVVKEQDHRFCSLECMNAWTKENDGRWKQ
jgi:hypothetical protein